MKVTKHLLLSLRNLNNKQAATWRIDKQLLEYLKEDSAKLGMSQVSYIEALILAKAASDSAADEKAFSLKLKEIREYF